MNNSLELILLVIVIGVAWWFLFRRGKYVNKSETIVNKLLLEIDYNLDLLELHLNDNQSRKQFKANTWLMYEDKLGFLGPELTAAMKDSFRLITEINLRIDLTRRGSDNAEIQIERLRDPLTRSKEGLLNWLKTNASQENTKL